METSITTIDAYIGQFPPDIREILTEIRRIIREEAPEAGEKIGYVMPTFTLNGNLVHFAAFKHHIGFYPAPSGIEAFQEELSAYKGAKGSVQFPLGEPVPYDLIRRIVRYRVEENRSKAGTGAKRKKT
ncbi:iron chaperone [Gorillibacterium sp. sgz5001074]|uniref:iron chaperone n=1 Tax=Gorillibacterium sp. sgz5001074 TaxID=3446695 RepID=UPI003F66CDE5